MKTTVVLLVLGLCLAACGDEPAPTATQPLVPAWAKVAPEQIAEAEKHGVPVAFENDLGMRFVLIPAGTFLMGSPEGEEGRGEDETQHEVTIHWPFYMSICEVTNGEYRRFDPKHESGGDEQQGLNEDQRPAVIVSWDEARNYAVWLTGRDSTLPEDRRHTYRLPTEAEWEYACRAGTLTPFSFGDAIHPGLANYCGIYAQGKGPGNARADPGIQPAAKRLEGPPTHGERTRVDPANRQRTTDVGTLGHNAWGLYDMHGNAGEWCAGLGWSGPDGDEAGFTTTIASTAIIRGGSWASGPAHVRSAQRSNFSSGGRVQWVSSMYVGLRLVSPLPEEGAPRAEPGTEGSTRRIARRPYGIDDDPLDQPDHAGEVLLVDAAANVTVISLGLEDGVRVGYRYVVSRGASYVALLEITDVQAKESAGRSIMSLQRSDIKVGDRVMSQ